jgi:hypothetical protein
LDKKQTKNVPTNATQEINSRIEIILLGSNVCRLLETISFGIWGRIKNRTEKKKRLERGEKNLKLPSKRYFNVIQLL